MKTFAAHLTESLNSSYTIVKKEWNDAGAHFSFLDDDDNIFHCHFEREEISRNDLDGVVIEVNFNQQTRRGLTTDLTNNSKNALKVYSTIGNALKRYVSEYPVNTITFYAAVTRTESIYRKLAIRIAKELDGKAFVKSGGFKVVLNRK